MYFQKKNIVNNFRSKSGHQSGWFKEFYIKMAFLFVRF